MREVVLPGTAFPHAETRPFDGPTGGLYQGAAPVQPVGAVAPPFGSAAGLLAAGGAPCGGDS
jgi:hypothetical protein